MTDVPISVENGSTAWIKLEGFEGRAGVRKRGESLEIAFRAKPVYGFPMPITVDGVAMRATQKAANAAPGFAVIIVEAL